jgi:hypothetical protein
VYQLNKLYEVSQKFAAINNKQTRTYKKDAQLGCKFRKKFGYMQQT